MALISYLFQEAVQALKSIESQTRLKGSIINLRIYSKEYLSEIINSCKKSKNLLILDTANESLSISHLIYYQISTLNLNIKMEIINMPDIPEPTSYYLTKNFYININTF